MNRFTGERRQLKKDKASSKPALGSDMQARTSQKSLCFPYPAYKICDEALLFHFQQPI